MEFYSLFRLVSIIVDTFFHFLLESGKLMDSKLIFEGMLYSSLINKCNKDNTALLFGQKQSSGFCCISSWVINAIVYWALCQIVACFPEEKLSD